VDDNDLKAALDKLHAQSLEKGGILVVLPTQHEFYSRAAAEKVDWAMFSPHMSIAFRGTLQHEPAPYVLTFVAVDLEGRVLGRWTSPYNETTAIVAEVGEWLDGREKTDSIVSDEAGLRRKAEADAKARAELDQFKIEPAK
jgi:hypothetical protein